MRSRLALLVLCLLWLPPRAWAGDEEGDVVGPIPWRADADTVFLRRIVEAATGKPVNGATVKLFCEVPHPEPGFGTPAATGTSGADGWVRIRKADIDPKITAIYGEPTWAYVEAKGLRPDALFQGVRETPDETRAFLDGDPDWSLTPSTTIRVALRDPLDRPVAGALVGWLLGCGHTPDVRQARTDSDGVAVIEEAAPPGHFGKLWPVKDGLASAYIEDDTWARWQRPTTARLAWGQVVDGVVLSHDGKPASGVGVGLSFIHRGPWTRTDARGRFHLSGLGVDIDGVSVEAGEFPVGPKAPPDGAVVSAWLALPPLGHRVTIRLPSPGKDPDDERPATRLVVEVDRYEWPKTEAPAGVDVFAVRVEDGWTATGFVGEQNVALFGVYPGSYVVIAVGRRNRSQFVVYSRAETNVVAPASGGAYVRLDLPPPALLTLSMPPAHDRTLELVAEGESEPLVDDPDGGLLDVLVPSDRPLFLRVTQGPRTRLVPIDLERLKGSKGTDHMPVPAFKSVEIRARFEDADGKPALGRLSELERGHSPESEDPPKSLASDRPVLKVLEGDHITLIAWPEDEVRFQPSFVEVPSVVASDKPFDLGATRLAPRAPRLRLEGLDGKPLDDVTLLVTSGDRSEEVVDGEGEHAGLFEDKWYAPGLLVEGALVRVKGVESFVRRLEGPGPWTIRPPAGSVSVSPQHADGAAIDTWVVFLDGRRFEAKGPSLTLRWVEDGRHEAIVDVPGTKPRRLAFDLAGGASRNWSPHLDAAVEGPR